MRKLYIAGNWKMNKTIAGSVELASHINQSSTVDVMIAPTFVSLSSVSSMLTQNNSSVILSAQNVYFEKDGAYTGEISCTMLKDTGCSTVIIGHSERRNILLESNELLNKKIKASIQNGLTVVFCVGELLAERESGKTNSVIEHQLISGLKDIADISSVIIAYEPVWAIGTGKVATPEQAQEVHDFIRAKIASMYSSSVADTVRILYGGSAKPDNAEQLLMKKDIDGLLIGGAALVADSFNTMIAIAEKIKK